MGRITLRFYEELNDFLPTGQRKRPFDYPLRPTQSIKHLIENLGVPHTEVEIILVNGRSVDFTYQPADGDRISVYPVFECLDVTPLLQLRPQPLREPRFIADAHLGKLARHLRLVGFDTLFFNDAGDHRLMEISLLDRRTLLSRDRALLMRRELTHGCFIHALDPELQLAELLRRLDLYRAMQPFTRCMECNGRLLTIDRQQVVGLLPKRVAEHYTEFWRCSDCEKIYWKGSHYRELSAFIERAAPLFPEKDF
ncbi:MAG: Mut7-C RNAse domain-containing protein [Chromatiales bacterium]